MTWALIYLCILLGTFFLAWWLTALCCRIAPRLGFVDKPHAEAHHAHTKITPVMGGLAMCIAWNAVILGGILLIPAFKSILSDSVAVYLPGINSVLPKLLMIAAGGIVFTTLGMIDDRKAMKAGPKFLCQFIVAALIATQFQVTLFHFLPTCVNWLLTALWIMTVVNAFNFFDNMDGLAAGTALIAAGFFLAVAMMRGQLFVALLSAAMFGVAGGFLMLNKAPARIFMGDGGSHFLGFNLAILGVMTTFYQNGESQTFLPVLIPILVLSLPLFDAITVVIIRLKEHRPIYIGDTRHISHRFVHLGLTRPRAVAIIWLLCLIQGTGALTLLWLPLPGAILIAIQEIAIFTVIAILQLTLQEKKQP